MWILSGVQYMKVKKKLFLHCEFCSKRLIERLPNGLFRFIFGGGNQGVDSPKPPPVDMLIHGSLKMRCTRRTCREWNVLNYFPPGFSQSVEKAESDNESDDLII